MSCINIMPPGMYPEAATAARAGLTAYPNSAFSRVCMLQALVAQKAAPDQIIEVASAIKTQDPHSAIAYANLSDAYMAKGDTTHAMEALLALYREDQSNTQLAKSIVAPLAQSGAPDKAIPIIESQLVNNPAAPEKQRQLWLFLLC